MYVQPRSPGSTPKTTEKLSFWGWSLGTSLCINWKFLSNRHVHMKCSYPSTWEVTSARHIIPVYKHLLDTHPSSSCLDVKHAFLLISCVVHVLQKLPQQMSMQHNSNTPSNKHSAMYVRIWLHLTIDREHDKHIHGTPFEQGDLVWLYNNAVPAGHSH